VVTVSRCRRRIDDWHAGVLEIVAPDASPAPWWSGGTAKVPDRNLVGHGRARGHPTRSGLALAERGGVGNVAITGCAVTGVRAAFYDRQGPAADVLRVGELPEPGLGRVRPGSGGATAGSTRVM
jgi:hypothetical protein